jgi:hypothetical protein
MIEITNTIKFILRHPIKDHQIELTFYDETKMDDWMPYLNKFEDFLIQEKLNALKKQ